MKDREELKKVEDFIETLYEKGKTTEAIKDELIKKGAPNEVLNQLILLAKKGDLTDNTDEYSISGTSLTKLKEPFIKRFNTMYFYRIVCSRTKKIGNGELWVVVIEYFHWFMEQTLSATLLLDFKEDNCDITSIISGGKGGWLKIDWFSENTFSKKITEFLKEICKENKWKFKQIKFRQDEMKERLNE